MQPVYQTISTAANISYRSYLDIQEVKIAGQKANWNVASRIEPYGSPLSIEFPGKDPDKDSGDVIVDVSLEMVVHTHLMAKHGFSDIYVDDQRLHGLTMVDPSSNLQQEAPIHVYV